MVGVGVASASTLAMPYAVRHPGRRLVHREDRHLHGHLHFFIVIPEVLAALGFDTLLERVLTNESALVMELGGDNRLAVIVIGGLSLAVAAALCTIVIEPKAYADSASSTDSAQLMRR